MKIKQNIRHTVNVQVAVKMTYLEIKSWMKTERVEWEFEENQTMPDERKILEDKNSEIMLEEI